MGTYLRRHTDTYRQKHQLLHWDGIRVVIFSERNCGNPNVFAGKARRHWQLPVDIHYVDRERFA